MFWRNKTVFYMSATGTIFATMCLVKDYRGGKVFPRNIEAEGKIFVVTGASSGIGEALTKQLAIKKATVYMACKDLVACEKARKDIVIETNNRYIYCRKCDLASFQSIRDFVKEFKSEQHKLDVLVNNAGVMRCPRSVTTDGIEMQLGVNHMGHFLLTNLLLDSLMKSDQGRIVILANSSYASGKINAEDLNLEKNYDPGVAYNQSNLANVLFLNELSIRLLGTKLTVNAVDPGWVNSNIVRHLRVHQGIIGLFYQSITWPYIKTSTAGSQTVLYAALDPSLDKVTGKLFRDMKTVEILKDAQNLDLAQWMWQVSEKWTRLKQ